MESTTNATAFLPTGTTLSTTSLPPLTVASLMSFLLSFSALHDWLKLFVIGGLLETCRRIGLNTWYSLTESIWITAAFDEDDCSYQWIMFWLSKHPSWAKARTVEISTRDFGLHSPASITEMYHENSNNDDRKISYLPTVATTYTIWYKRHYTSVNRYNTNIGTYRTKEGLQLRILARNHSILTDLLKEAKDLYMAAQENHISIYGADISNNWRHVTSRPKRSLKSIVLEPGFKDMLLEDAKDFLASKTWYADRGIPFRRGYLLYGAPGCGKTSVIHSLAGELGLDIYVISLSRFGLDDTSLGELISDLPGRCIAVMEDIDAAFQQGVARNMENESTIASPGDSSESENPLENKPKETKESSMLTSRVTLSGLLNALDGLSAQEGRLLFATTNCYSVLDPALSRPGRMDLHIEFRLASKYQANELFKCFFLPTPSASNPPAVEKPQPSEKTANANLIDLGPSSPTSATGEKHSSRKRMPALSSEEICVLAERFADAIPQHEFSMAALQGYLMTYKVRPQEAAEEASAWVEKELKERQVKARKTKRS